MLRIIMLVVISLIVLILSVVILSAMAPYRNIRYKFGLNQVLELTFQIYQIFSSSHSARLTPRG